ncbi:hypothetical protein D3C78_693900 [compost metagenome]
MGLIHFLLNIPSQRRIRFLQASLELLTARVVDLEEAICSATFPDKETRQKLSEKIGQHVKISSEYFIVEGKLRLVNHDSLEIHDQTGQLVIVPAGFISKIEFTIY